MQLKQNHGSLFSNYGLIQYLIGVTATLGCISCEMHYGWSSPSVPLLTSGSYRIKITSDEASWLTVTILLGTIIGAFTAGFITDVFGRKKIILFLALPLLVSWLMIGFAKSVYIMFIARMLAGISDGLCFSTVPMYLGEIAEPKIRGMISSLCPVFLVFGILVINALGNYLPIDTAAFISSGLPILQFLLFIWMPEAPPYLLRKGKIEEAKKVLYTLRGKENGDLEFDRLTEAYKEQNKNGKINLKYIFKTKNTRKAMFIVLGLRTLQQLSGGTAIVFYCKTIFEEANDFISPNIGTLIYFSLQLIMVVISSVVVDTFGRRPLILVSSTGTALSLFIIGGYLYVKNSTAIVTSSFNFVPVLGLLGFVIFFSLGIQTMPFLMAGEIFSPEIKSTSVSIGALHNCIMAILSSKLFHIANDTFGMHVAFFCFGICCVLGGIWSYFYLPETKKKTLEDIQRELKGLPLEDIKNQ